MAAHDLLGQDQLRRLFAASFRKQRDQESREHLDVHEVRYAVPLMLCYFTATVVLASLSWRFLETPLNDLKRFFPYRRQRNDNLDAAQPAADHRAAVMLKLGLLFSKSGVVHGSAPGLLWSRGSTRPHRRAGRRS